MLHEDARDAAAIVGRDGKVLKETGLDMYPILSGDWQRYEGFVWKILLTPDEYAVGDFDLLAERRQFFANLARNSLGWNDRQIKAQFEEAIRGWPELSGRKGADRMMRYWDFLDKRFNNQETRRERFNHKREVFRLPQIETFYQAMTESKGKLTMLPQYALQGIDLSKEELVGEIRELQREVVVNPG